MSAELPLFPLGTVLFPDGPLNLRIFEARYVDMVRRCLRAQEPFGVVLILDGLEAGTAERLAGTGTTARIVDFSTLADGLLGLTCLGERRFRLESRRAQADGLNLATVQFLGEAPAVPLPPEHAHLGELLREVLPRLGEVYAHSGARYEDAGWVSDRWTELLPLAATERQALLELDDPLERLARIAALAALHAGGQAAAE